MPSRIDQLLSILLTASAVAVAGSVVHRTFIQPRAPQETAGPPVFIEEWKDALAAGTRIGPDSAPITIVDVADLECPVCRGFYATLRDVMAKYPSQVAAIHVSFPLSYHKFALPAARGAECAAEEGRFSAWIDAIYSKQDSLGIKSWGAYAIDAGVRDTVAMNHCVLRSDMVPKIELGRGFGEKIGVTGTPTVLVNGWKLPGAPSQDRLIAVIEELLQGKNPFGNKWFARGG